MERAHPGPRWSALAGSIQGTDGAPMECAIGRRWIQSRSQTRTNSQIPTRAPPIAPRERIRRSEDPGCNMFGSIVGSLGGALPVFFTPRPPFGRPSASIWSAFGLHGPWALGPARTLHLGPGWALHGRSIWALDGPSMGAPSGPWMGLKYMFCIHENIICDF